MSGDGTTVPEIDKLIHASTTNVISMHKTYTHVRTETAIAGIPLLYITQLYKHQQMVAIIDALLYMIKQHVPLVNVYMSSTSTVAIACKIYRQL